MYEEEPIASSSPKLKQVVKRKAKNSRHSVSLLDVSAVEVIPEVTSQKCESFSNETLTSVCKDSGYVRSESSFSAEDEPKASGKNLIDELKSKQILIEELQESNKGLRIRCADAESKIFKLRLKCESHCDCCQKDGQRPLDSDDKWNWRHGHLEASSKDFFNFRRHPFSNSVKFDESGREISRLNRTCPPGFPCEVDASSSDESPLPMIGRQDLTNVGRRQTAEDLSLSKVEWWQNELLAKKLPNRTANPRTPKIQRSISDLDDNFRPKTGRQVDSRDRPTLAKHGSLHRLADYPHAGPTDDWKFKKFASRSTGRNFTPARNNSLSNLATSFAELSIADLPTDRDLKSSDFGSCNTRILQPIADVADSLPNPGIPSALPNFSRECQTEPYGDRAVDRVCCCHNRMPVPFVIVVPTAGCCSLADRRHNQDLCCCQGTCEHSAKRVLPEFPDCGTKFENDCSICQCAGRRAERKTASPNQNSKIVLNDSPAQYCSCKTHSAKLSTESQMVDPKEELKRRIEEGMQRIASDCRAEMNSLSFKPWPPPNFANMSPLVRCLAETSQYVRRIAVGLDEATGRIQRVSPQIRQTNPSF